MGRNRPVLGAPQAERDKVLGSLPVIAGFCRRLDIGGIVDRACPVRDVAIATHGQVIEALVANRLTSPQPLLHVEDWAREWAVAEVFGLDPGALNDDRLGRALDAVAPALAGVVGSVGVNAIAGFGIDTSRIHWDMTSISLFGDYDHLKEGSDLRKSLDRQVADQHEWVSRIRRIVLKKWASRTRVEHGMRRCE